ncbi:MAG: flagellar hook-length control protein FliK [Nitrospira sp.]|nr:flagellar hook-length control protein FliK [Nitrospira sp.]
MSALILPAPPMPSMTAPETHKGESSSDGAATQSKDQPKQAATMSAHSTKSDAQTGPIVKDDVQAVIGGAAIKTAVAAVETHAASSGQETGRSRPQSDGLSQSQSNLNSGPVSNDGGINRSMNNDAARIVEGTPLVRPASPHSDDHAPSHGGKEDAKSKTEVVLPFDDPALSSSDDGSGESKVSAALLRSHQSSVDVTKHFVELKAGQIGSLQDQAETELPQAAVVEPQVTGGQPIGSTMSEAQVGIGSSSPPPPPTTPFVSYVSPAMPSYDPGDKSAQVMTRSVVFDVAQPDLGHVNIRVAITNDVVHTHLSADRAEVGQFLISGQDRLQAALQANGLDMGQFRVDIDRQNGGRSFHHGSSQEQGQTWDQGSQGMNWGQSQDRQDEQRTSLHGLLNLVA